MTNKETKQEEIKEDVQICLRLIQDMVKDNKFYGASCFIEDITQGIKTLKEFSK